MENIIDSLIYSFWYNRETDDILKTIDHIINRLLSNEFDSKGYEDDDANIIYGFLVLKYGEYGTSPRSGWFKNHEKKKLISIFTHYKDNFEKEDQYE